MALLLFDLNGTLLDPGPQAALLQSAVRLAMAHTLAGEFLPFSDLLEAAGGRLPDAMPPFPDVDQGLGALAADGHRLVVLTNSATRTAERHLAAAGLRDRFTAVIGADEGRLYKPAADAYESALERLGAEPTGSWLVAAHDWDLIGARGAGLWTAFVDRGGPPPATMEPDARLAALGELVAAARSRG